MGFNSNHLETTNGNCVEMVSVSDINNSLQKVSIKTTSEKNQITDELYSTISAGANLGRGLVEISGSRLGYYLSEDIENTFRFTLYTQSNIGTKAISNFALNDKAFSALKSERFLEFCGDSFIQAIHFSNHFSVDIFLTSNKDYDYQKVTYKVKVKALWGLLKKTQTWTVEEEEFIANSTISISINTGGSTLPTEFYGLIDEETLNFAGNNKIELNKAKSLAEHIYEFSTSTRIATYLEESSMIDRISVALYSESDLAKTVSLDGNNNSIDNEIKLLLKDIAYFIVELSSDIEKYKFILSTDGMSSYEYNTLLERIMIAENTIDNLFSLRKRCLKGEIDLEQCETYIKDTIGNQ